MSDGHNSRDSGDSGDVFPPPRWYGDLTRHDTTHDTTAPGRHEASPRYGTTGGRTAAPPTDQVDTTGDTTGAEVDQRNDAVDGARAIGRGSDDLDVDVDVDADDRPHDTAGDGDGDGGSSVVGRTGAQARSTPPSAPLGPDASVREVARAARDAFLSTDLLHSGPGLWPFGRRARERRDRNRAATAEAQRRRDQFRTAFDTGFGTGFDTGFGAHHRTRRRRGGAGWSRVDRRAHALVVAGLVGVVVAVVVAAVWWGGRDPRPASESASSPAPVSSPASESSTAAGSSPTATGSESVSGSLPARPPIPPGGAEAVTPGPNTPVDAGSVRVVDPPAGEPTPVELGTPEGAMRAWLARLCPFDYSDAFGAVEQRARAAMTEAGWATLNPVDGDAGGDVRDERARASWATTVAAGESGRCAEPTALISPEASRSAASAIVIGTVSRVVTRVVTAPDSAADQAPYAEQVSQVRLVRRGADGLWRVDVPAEGG